MGRRLHDMVLLCEKRLNTERIIKIPSGFGAVLFSRNANCLLLG